MRISVSPIPSPIPLARFLVLLGAVALGASACGGEVPIEAGSEAQSTIPGGSSDTTTPEPSADPTVIEGAVIGTGNIGGPVVNPQAHRVGSIAIAESYPEQLMVSFLAGDPNCTAADGYAHVIDGAVRVTVFVGITEDALTRSCLAGTDFEHTLSIPLVEGLDGRELVYEQ